MVIRREGKIDWFETLFEMLPVVLTIILIALAVILVFGAIFIRASECQANMGDKDEGWKKEKYFARKQAQNSQVTIWGMEIQDKIPTVVGFGIIRDEHTVITARHIFNRFFQKTLVYFAVSSDFYYVDDADADMIAMIGGVNLYGSVVELSFSNDKGLKNNQRISFIVREYEIGEDIFVLGDHNNAEALEYIDGKIISQDNNDLIIELLAVNSNLIDRQIALGATVWDAKGNFIGFLAERVGVTNKVQLIFFK